LHKVYRVLLDEDTQADGDLRVIDESGEDYLFPAGFFVPDNLLQPIARVLNKSYTRPIANA
jgi:hypothetical protein